MKQWDKKNKSMTLHLCGNISGILSADRPSTPRCRSIYPQVFGTARKQREGEKVMAWLLLCPVQCSLSHCRVFIQQQLPGHCYRQRGLLLPGAMPPSSPFALPYSEIYRKYSDSSCTADCSWLKIFTSLSFSLICSSIGLGKVLLYLRKMMYTLFHTKEVLAVFSPIFKREIVTKNLYLNANFKSFVQNSRYHNENSISWGSNGESFTRTENANTH